MRFALNVDSGRSRPRIRDEVGRQSDLMSLGVIGTRCILWPGNGSWFDACLDSCTGQYVRSRMRYTRIEAMLPEKTSPRRRKLLAPWLYGFAGATYSV